MCYACPKFGNFCLNALYPRYPLLKSLSILYIVVTRGWPRLVALTLNVRRLLGAHSFFFFLSLKNCARPSAVEKRPQQLRFLIQSQEKKRTRSGRSAASSGRTAEVLRPVEEGGLDSNSLGGEQRQRPTTGSAVAVMMSSPARGRKHRRRSASWRLAAAQGACGSHGEKRPGSHCWYGLDLCSWKEVPEGAHCRPIPISCTRAP